MPIPAQTRSIALTLIVGIPLSVLAALAVARWERANYRLQFQRQADSLATALQRSINRYTDLLLALGDLYSVSENSVERDEFDRFVSRSLATYPGIQALEWAPLVKDSDRAEFEAALQNQGFPTFQIRERDSQDRLVQAARRPQYVPVTYLQPWLGNEPAFGYDLTSDPTRRKALETAEATGKIAASGRIRLVQENKNQFGFLVFLPLYETHSTAFSQAQRPAVSGYLLGVFRVSDVVEESLRTLTPDIDMSLSDRTAAPSEQFLGIYNAAMQEMTTDGEQMAETPRSLCHAPQTCSQTLAIGGREWAVTFAPAASYPPLAMWSSLSTLVIGFLLTAIVARSLAQAEAEVARTKELSALKLRLFSMTSHELRTPLSTILLSAQTLETNSQKAPQTFDLANQQRVYGRIRAAAKRMNQLVNDRLTLSRAESGKLQFEPAILNLGQYCQQLIEEVRYSFETPPSIQLVALLEQQQVYLDPQLLQTIVSNLLSNAVKYSGNDPKVTLSLIEQTHQIILQVQDHGIGIPEADQAHLHKAFYRGTNVGQIEGTGLGLSVVKACLQLHQGSLAYNSTIGEGTCFQVTLPKIE